jgi:hypothetical protein
VPNSLLSPTIITREALRILHAKLNFIGNVDKQYDNQFANSGASPSGKIGPTLTIRMPNQYTTRSGSTLSVQDTTETSQILTVSTQKGVDFNFTSQDLTLTIDEFSKRYLKPAIAVLATNIEADALSMVKDVYNAVDDNAATFSTYKDFANGRKTLNQYLAPDMDRVVSCTPGMWFRSSTRSRATSTRRSPYPALTLPAKSARFRAWTPSRTRC